MTNKGKYTSPEGSSTWEYISATSCALLIFCVGCIGGWSSPTLSRLMEPDSIFPLSSSDVSTLSAVVAVGHAIAPMITMLTADRIGRIKGLLATGIPTIISWALIAFSQIKWVLIVARFIAGFSIGFMYCFCPMYLGEIASPKLRGSIGMVCGTMINAGILFMYIFVPYTSITLMSSICLTIALISVISIFFVPESPYFLVKIGQFDKAESSLEKLRGKTDVTEELELIKTTISEKAKASKRELKNDDEEEGIGEDNGKSSFKKLFAIGGNRKALYINFLFIGVIQLGSYLVIMVYGQLIFEKMKTTVPSHLCTMITAGVQLISNISTAFVIDKVGRKPLICLSGIISGICLLVVGVYFCLMENEIADVTPYGIIALAAIFVNIIALNVGLMPMQMIIQSEIIDTDVKQLATCILGVGGGIAATIGLKTYLMVAETWGFGHSVPFLVLAFNIFLMTALIMKELPETKGKTLLDIQRDLNA